jgi:hypothetical protein
MNKTNVPLPASGGNPGSFCLPLAIPIVFGWQTVACYFCMWLAADSMLIFHAADFHSGNLQVFQDKH